MKTLYDFYKDNEGMEKRSSKLLALTLAGTAIGSGAGALQSVLTSPPEGEHDEIQAETIKTRLYDILADRAKRKRIKNMEAVVAGARRAVRI